MGETILDVMVKPVKEGEKEFMKFQLTCAIAEICENLLADIDAEKLKDFQKRYGDQTNTVLTLMYVTPCVNQLLMFDYEEFGNANQQFCDGSPAFNAIGTLIGQQLARYLNVEMPRRTF